MKERGHFVSAEELFEPLLNDPDFKLESAFESYTESGNPYFAWEAVKVCNSHNKPFPDWLCAYLGDCADRITSPEAAAGGHDLRKVLPWIFGFPNKRGPGNLLKPTESAEELCDFAYKFAFRVAKGEQPSAAMRDACIDAFDGKMAEADEKTLRRWLCRVFDLKDWPADQTQWKKYLLSILSQCLQHSPLLRTEFRETLTCHRARPLPAFQ
jgi:hypothetical protein